MQANCTEIAQLRTKGLVDGAHGKQDEWRRAKDEFSERKLKLIDKETKKRMLEEIWNDRVEIDQDEADKQAEETREGKEQVKALKAANREARLQLREQAVLMEGRLDELRERTTSLRAQLDRTTALQEAAAEQQRREAAKSASLAATRQQTAEADAALADAQAANEELQRKLGELVSGQTRANQQVQLATQEYSATAQLQSRAEARANALATTSAARAEWLEQVHAPRYYSRAG